MAVNTTNLDLLKKESTDIADTFNIPVILNDNWDKIDQFAGNIPNIKGIEVDTTGLGADYTLKFDSVNNKWVVADTDIDGGTY